MSNFLPQNLRLRKIDNIDYINQIALIYKLNNIETVDLITLIETIRTINTIQKIDELKNIVNIGNVQKFGEAGTWLPFKKTVTSDILSPDEGYKLKILGAFYYCAKEITTELRFKTSENLVLALPTSGSIGMNPQMLRKPIGAKDEPLTIYLSGVGTAKGWIVYDQMKGKGTSHSKTITESVGFVDAVATEHTPAGGGWVSPTDWAGVGDAGGWYYPEKAYDGIIEAYCYTRIYASSWGPFLILEREAITCNKVRIYTDTSPYNIHIVDVDVYKDGVWVDVYDGELPDEEWLEILFTSGSVTKMRIRCYNSHGSLSYNRHLYEAEFWGIP